MRSASAVGLTCRHRPQSPPPASAVVVMERHPQPARDSSTILTENRQAYAYRVTILAGGHWTDRDTGSQYCQVDRQAYRVTILAVGQTGIPGHNTDSQQTGIPGHNTCSERAGIPGHNTDSQQIGIVGHNTGSEQTGIVGHNTVRWTDRDSGSQY